MIPKPLSDKQIKFFKFWFNQRLQEGLCYQNELFYCWQNLTLDHRFKLYREGVQLAKQGAEILITDHKTHYCLWVSFRSHPCLLQVAPSSFSAILLSKPSTTSREFASVEGKFDPKKRKSSP